MEFNEIYTRILSDNNFLQYDPNDKYNFYLQPCRNYTLCINNFRLYLPNLTRFQLVKSTNILLCNFSIEVNEEQVANDLFFKFPLSEITFFTMKQGT